MSDIRSAGRSLPGEVGLWVFIFFDLGLFGLFFALAAADLGGAPAVFAAGKGALDLTIGAVNTLVLLTGSWAAAMATRVAVGGREVSRWLTAAALSGVLFLVLKVLEYSHLLGAGHAITESAFYTWYFILTGYHALHVALGIVLLAVVAARYREEAAPGQRLVEAAGCYWHLVDLLWIGIFLILYLI
jgi:nitric oxide reductase NorE protein